MEDEEVCYIFGRKVGQGGGQDFVSGLDANGDQMMILISNAVDGTQLFPVKHW